MKKIHKLLTVLILCLAVMLSLSSSLLFAQTGGFANVSSGGPTVTVSNTSQFLDYISRSGSYIINISGTIYLSGMNDVASNKTIRGGAITGGGLDIDGVTNVVIQNVAFSNWSDDAINIQEGSTHIWVDHCSFTNGYDGAVDIKRESDFITISWNHFYNHGKTCLLGHSDNHTEDIGHLRVTYHHNFFDGTDSRHPRVRFSALCHVYNNYYLNNEYGIASTQGAEVLVEGNYFQNCEDPTLVGYASSGPGDLVQRNNIFDGNTGSPQTQGSVPNPPYSYFLDNAGNIPSLVSSNAGPGGNSCNPTAITPYVQVNGGSWQGATNITVNSGDEVRFGPQPVSGGSWSWSGCGTSGSSREQTIYPTNSCTATATYTNSCGATSTQSFNITVTGGTTYYQLQNRATGLFLDGMGRTTNGDPCGQYANTTHVNSQWELIDVGDGYNQLRNRGTGLFLDGMGRTNNGADCGQYANTTHQNSHWSLQQYSGSYYRIQNRGTGLFLDGMGYTANGDVVGQWANTTSQNAQWQLINVGSGARVAAETTEDLDREVLFDQAEKVLFYPNPMNDVLNIRLQNNDESAVAKIYNLTGNMVLTRKLTEMNNEIEVRNLENGTYFVEVSSSSEISRFKLIKE